MSHIPVSPDNPEALDLWLLMLKVFHRLRHAVAPIFAARDLTGPQWRIIRLLGEAGEQRRTPGQISEELRVTHGNTTGIVDKLEEAGLVQRVPHPDDRRALLISLTERGTEVYATVRPVLAQRVEELLGCLGVAERQQLAGALGTLLAHLEQTLPEGGRRCGTNGSAGEKPSE